MGDLLDLKSVRKFAKDIGGDVEKIDILVNNAGMADGRKDKVVTRSKDKFEITLQTNHLSHFLLTNLLKSKLAAARNSRVINVSSLANIGGVVDLDNLNYEKEFTNPYKTYHNSKLMNIMFSKEIAARWKNIGVTSYSLHPGFVRTNIANDFSPVKRHLIHTIGYMFEKNSFQGAQASLYLCCEPEIEELSGQYFSDCKVTAGPWLNKQALDKDI